MREVWSIVDSKEEREGERGGRERERGGGREREREKITCVVWCVNI